MFLERFEIIKVGSALSFIAVVWWCKGGGGCSTRKEKNIIVSSNVDVKMQGA